MILVINVTDSKDISEEIIDPWFQGILSWWSVKGTFSKGPISHMHGWSDIAVSAPSKHDIARLWSSGQISADEVQGWKHWMPMTTNHSRGTVFKNCDFMMKRTLLALFGSQQLWLVGSHGTGSLQVCEATVNVETVSAGFGTMLLSRHIFSRVAPAYSRETCQATFCCVSVLSENAGLVLKTEHNRNTGLLSNIKREVDRIPLMKLWFPNTPTLPLTQWCTCNRLG